MSLRKAATVVVFIGFVSFVIVPLLVFVVLISLVHPKHDVIEAAIKQTTLLCQSLPMIADNLR